MASPATYSLLELNQYIRRVISLNFDQPLWIECEISQAGTSRGHWYLDLIQKEGEQIVAQVQAALWANVYHFLKRKSAIAPEELLKQGLAVKLKVNVDYHERYGLKLIIEDIDAHYTIGKLALQRESILQVLREKALLDRNRQRPLPAVIQRLAVISSSRAAGWIDFDQHLRSNRYGYDIRVTLFDAAMQGQSVESDVLEAFRQIESKVADFDAVAILRGGGGRTDLAVFDNLPLAQRLADFPLPVIVGIGHEIDQSVLDIVAHTSLKTPTAVADFIVDHNTEFELRLQQLALEIREVANVRLQAESDHLTALADAIQYGVREELWRQQARLAQWQLALRHGTRTSATLQHHRLDRLETLLDAIDPDHVLARGYSITSQHGKTITRVADVDPKAPIRTTFLDGNLDSQPT